MRADATRPTGAIKPVVALRDVTMTFQSVTALRNISIAAREGKVLALLGDNGAGKSTLIKVLSGVYQPRPVPSKWTGTRSHCAALTTPARPASRRCSRTSPSATSCRLPATWCSAMNRSSASGRCASTPGRRPVTTDALAALGVDLGRQLSDPAATLSGGQKQAVAIARAIVYGSRCLILDEPTAALAVRQTGRCSIRCGARGTRAEPSS